MANFFYYGCEKLMVAPLNTQDGTYETPWEEKYVKQIGIGNGSSSSNRYYGSNRTIFRDSGSAGKTLDVQTSAFSDDFYEKCLGQQIVDGIRMEGPNDVAKPFALGCEIEGDNLRRADHDPRHQHRLRHRGLHERIDGGQPDRDHGQRHQGQEDRPLLRVRRG